MSAFVVTDGSTCLGRMARLDADRTAKPRTELVAHVPTDGRCVRPGDWIDELRDVKATSWFQYRVHTGPTIVRDCCEWMRQAGIEAEAGTEHVYGKLQAVDRADAMERIDAALGFRVATLASVWAVAWPQDE